MFALTLVVRASMQICSQNVGHFRKWFLLNGLFKLFSHYFRNSHFDEWQKCRDTCMRYNMIKHSKRCVVEHPNCFTMTRSNLRWNSAEQLHHPTRSRTFFHRHSIIPDNKYVWNVCSRSNIFVLWNDVEWRIICVVVFISFSRSISISSHSKSNDINHSQQI